ncbi:MAG: histidinol-phosphatase HisJ family protein, partial [Vallitaleaceae bacterium]|nr:histidinol-phosphatase HisJ family protein [Vallitaleaceae bacterium]
MILSDFHLHSSFSGDCESPMEEVIIAAIEKNIKYLCFTEHHDLEFPECGIDFELDIPAYYTYITNMKEKYKDQITILMGIEIGMQQHLYDQLDQLIKNYPFDFILASNHLGQGVDPYQPEYFNNVSKKEAFTIYFKDILFNVKYYDNFDSYGHLDYVMRYYPHGDKMYEYQDYKVILDQILTYIIDKGK